MKFASFFLSTVFVLILLTGCTTLKKIVDDLNKDPAVESFAVSKIGAKVEVKKAVRPVTTVGTSDVVFSDVRGSKPAPVVVAPVALVVKPIASPVKPVARPAARPAVKPASPLPPVKPAVK